MQKKKKKRKNTQQFRKHYKITNIHYVLCIYSQKTQWQIRKQITSQKTQGQIWKHKDKSETKQQFWKHNDNSDKPEKVGIVWGSAKWISIDNKAFRMRYDIWKGIKKIGKSRTWTRVKQC